MAKTKFARMYKTVSQIKKSIEVKVYDQYIFYSQLPKNSSTNNNVFFCNRVGSGSAGYERIGRKITLQSWSVCLDLTHVLMPNTTVPIYGIYENGVRVAMVYDKSPANSPPTYYDIFATQEVNGASTSGWTSPQNMGTKDRFTVLSDEHIPMNQQGGSLTLGDYQYRCSLAYKKTINLRNRIATYDGSSTPPSYGDINVGALYLVVYPMNFSTSIAGGNGKTYITINDSNSRIRYTDA